MEKCIIENGIKYELKGEQYYPMLETSKQTEYHIGKYGQLHLSYIKQHKRGTYTTLLTEGRLNAHLHKIDVQANAMVEAIVADIARERGVDEELKASDTFKCTVFADGTEVFANFGNTEEQNIPPESFIIRKHR